MRDVSKYPNPHPKNISKNVRACYAVNADRLRHNFAPLPSRCSAAVVAADLILLGWPDAPTFFPMGLDNHASVVDSLTAGASSLGTQSS